MGQETGIQWTDHTFNPWRGCTKVSPGCTHCYADTQSKRNPGTLGVWGDKGTRVVAAESYWLQPKKWNDAAKAGATTRRVFCASLADVFEDWQGPMVDSQGRTLRVGAMGGWMDRKSEPSPHCRAMRMDDVRRRLFETIDATPWLAWQLLTKRPGSVMPFLHSRRTDPRPNVWLGTSVEDVKRKDRIDVLRKLPAAVRFLSIEPLLEYLGAIDLTGIHWVIIGGESGGGARTCSVNWVRDVVIQCREQGVKCFVKQLGAHVEAEDGIDPLDQFPNGTDFKQGSGESARILLNHHKGGDIDEWPEDLRVREFPAPAI